MRITDDEYHEVVDSVVELFKVLIEIDKQQPKDYEEEGFLIDKDGNKTIL